MPAARVRVRQEAVIEQHPYANTALGRRHNLAHQRQTDAVVLPDKGLKIDTVGGGAQCPQPPLQGVRTQV